MNRDRRVNFRLLPGRIPGHGVQAVLLIGFCLATTSCGQENDYSGELPRIPPTSPQQALETFSVAPGFRMELVASEPLIGTPVAIEWNADGQLFVCEMRGYSEQRDDALSSIALLTDDDDDGVYDRRTTYAEGLLWPTAIFPFDGGLFVGDAPNLYYLKDHDGDGRVIIDHIDSLRRGILHFGGCVLRIKERTVTARNDR